MKIAVTLRGSNMCPRKFYHEERVNRYSEKLTENFPEEKENKTVQTFTFKEHITC